MAVNLCIVSTACSDGELNQSGGIPHLVPPTANPWASFMQYKKSAQKYSGHLIPRFFSLIQGHVKVVPVIQNLRKFILSSALNLLPISAILEDN